MARAEATVAEATTPLLASCDTPADFVPRKQLLEENKKLKEQLSEFEKARVKEETDKKEKKGKTRVKEEPAYVKISKNANRTEAEWWKMLTACRDSAVGRDRFIETIMGEWISITRKELQAYVQFLVET